MGPHAGICCHFCRQKKLCGEPDCKRCIDRNPDIPCIGDYPPSSLPPICSYDQQHAFWGHCLLKGSIQHELRAVHWIILLCHAGKSECSRCQSATGRFCRACLLVRYGEELESVRAEMAAGTWLCPHCYEEDHADEVSVCSGGCTPVCTALHAKGCRMLHAILSGKWILIALYSR